jgi:hypothetical protein
MIRGIISPRREVEAHQVFGQAPCAAGAGLGFQRVDQIHAVEEAATGSVADDGASDADRDMGLARAVRQRARTGGASLARFPQPASRKTFPEWSSGGPWTHAPMAGSLLDADYPESGALVARRSTCHEHGRPPRGNAIIRDGTAKAVNGISPGVIHGCFPSVDDLQPGDTKY